MGELSDLLKDEQNRNSLIVAAALANGEPNIIVPLTKHKHGQQKPSEEQIQSAIDVTTKADTVTDMQRMLLYIQKEKQARTGTALPAEDQVVVNGNWHDVATVKALDGVLKEAKTEPEHDAFNGTFAVFRAFTGALDRQEPLPEGKKRKAEPTTGEAGWLGGTYRFPHDVGDALDKLQQLPEYQVQSEKPKFQVVDVNDGEHHHHYPRHRSGKSIPHTRDELAHPVKVKFRGNRIP